MENTKTQNIDTTTELIIKNPCPMLWGKLQKTGHSGERFCGSCKSIIKDFTNYSKEEIIEYRKNNPLSCGKFRTDQLTYRPMHNKGVRYKLRFFALTIASFLGFQVAPIQAAKPPKTKKIIAWKKAKHERQMHRRSCATIGILW